MCPRMPVIHLHNTCAGKLPSVLADLPSVKVGGDLSGDVAGLKAGLADAKLVLPSTDMSLEGEVAHCKLITC